MDTSAATRIGRHFVTVNGRRVHYRRSGSGPPVLLIHQNPRSSAEMVPLMQAWSGHFTCIAPDTVGLGLSDPLPGDEPAIGEIAAALIDFLDAIGAERVGAFGFHSGAVQLMEALNARSDRFFAMALGGYGLWTAEEQKQFDETFIPRFAPCAYGEHLVWLWNRLLEQGWFFPWHCTREANRLSAAAVNPAALDVLAGEWLDAGDGYRQAFAGCLRAPRALPPASASLPPVLITAYEGDPLRKHFARAALLPANWRIEPVATEADQRAASRDFLMAHAANAAAPALREDPRAGFVAVRTAAFDGLVHWRGDRSANRVVLHAPGSSLCSVASAEALCLDLPGHGLSDPFAGAQLEDWVEIVAGALDALGCGSNLTIVGAGPSALLALAVARRVGAEAVEGVEAHIPHVADAECWIASQPDLSPRRFGEHLVEAWGIARAAQAFWPWFDVARETMIPVAPDDLAPARLAQTHRDVLRARPGSRPLLAALLRADRAALIRAAPPIRRWHLADWATDRADVWRPDSVCLGGVSA